MFRSSRGTQKIKTYHGATERRRKTIKEKSHYGLTRMNADRIGGLYGQNFHEIIVAVGNCRKINIERSAEQITRVPSPAARDSGFQTKRLSDHLQRRLLQLEFSQLALTRPANIRRVATCAQFTAFHGAEEINQHIVILR